MGKYNQEKPLKNCTVNRNMTSELYITKMDRHILETSLIRVKL